MLAATSLAAVVAIAVLLSAVIVTGGLFVLGWYVFHNNLPMNKITCEMTARAIVVWRPLTYQAFFRSKYYVTIQ